MRVLLTMLLLSGMNAIAQPYRLMTYNIRYDNPQDGDDRWSLRGKGLIGLIRKSDPDALGLQEVLASQLSDISKEMKGYESIGVGRDDGAQAGEYAPLFIRTKRFAIRSSGWFWLSDTPDEPGKGWDAACNRISTWAIVKDKSAKRDLLIINTHLDHVGKVARTKSVEQLLSFIREKSDTYLEETAKEDQGGMAVILMGDFNFSPIDPSYKSLKESIQVLRDPLVDAHEATANPPVGPEATYNAFDLEKSPTERIDYIWTAGLEIRSYRSLEEKLETGRWPSDHLPVLVEAEPTE